MIHNMVIGGGSGKLFAVIAVTYPEGSICTCSDGAKTLKAKDTSGKALFNVPVGEWTVTATDGSSTTSQAVSITAEGQSESVTLNYYLAVLENGVLSPLTGGIDGLNSNTKFTNGKIVCATVNGAAGHYFTTKNKINMTPYSTLYCRITFTDKYSYRFRFGVTTTKLENGALDYEEEKFICMKDIQDSSITIGGTKEISLDISGVSKDAYIAICSMHQWEVDKIILYP